ncbi:MAG: DUF108 domain-containing protein [Candidatus Omnitrophica bacterium]|nr:DUF108 domain-containing protein [Candidatus Omnitrophota bacterium]
MRKIKVGIIGCGTIGSALANFVVRHFSDAATLSFIAENHSEKVTKLWHALGQMIPNVSVSKLIQGSDLVIEAATASISAQVAKEALQQHKQVLILSVGGLLESKGWKNALRRSHGRLWIPSGAIAGIDGLVAAKEAGISRVKIITKKPPAGLKEAPYFWKRKFPELRGTKAYCVFRGSADEAVRGFPQNVNVAATLSLAGIGSQKTQVEIWTSRSYKTNQHEILIEGKSGRIRITTQNVPAPGNPKTSALALYSAIAVIRRIISTVRIGT